MSRQRSDRVKLNLSLAQHVKATLIAQAKVAGLDANAHVTTLIMREEQRLDIERRMREGVPRHLAVALEQGKEKVQ